MADVPDSTLKILTSEVGNDSPATSATMYKIGGAINFLLDRAVEFFEYNTPGVHNLVIPANIEQIYFQGCGGGGGGGGSGAVSNGGGGGGGAPICSGFVRVTPGDTLTITVGGAGSGGAALTDGSAGSASSITGFLVNVSMPGGGGGLSGSNPVPSGGHSVQPPFIGAQGGNGFYGSSSASNGQSSIFASGGASGGGTGGDGGGGGAAFGAGGAGGGDSSSAASPVANAYGAGGGGGDNGGSTVGASGMSGLVRIWYGF